MSLLPKKRARIVRDSYAGYEVQCWRWWFPIWVQAGAGGLITNTHRTINGAEAFAKEYLTGGFVKEVKLATHTHTAAQAATDNKQD